MNLSCNQTSHEVSTLQDYCVREEGKKCIKYYEEYKSQINHEKSCAPVFDQILCWNSTLANTVVEVPCPKFFVGFNIQGANATKRCTENGTWYISEETKQIWTNYSECYNSTEVTIPVTNAPFNKGSFPEYLPIIKLISRTGYIVSFSTLVVAFCIMFYFKKLHCARNKLHMHLFASFIFRAAISFIKDIVFIDSVGTHYDILIKDGGSYVIDDQFVGKYNWQCKFVSSLWQYFITANYSWILMEGVYLHNLILMALFTESTNSIKYYIIFGWGLPVIVIGVYVIARLKLDNTLCWTIYNENIFLFLRIPTGISVLINFVLFINIARVLLLKLRSPISEETKLYRRWARSTLVLVPLFGVHYAIFVSMTYFMGKNETVEIVWLFCDLLFASFQGFFVAVLYCFLNGEVKTELRPHINNFITICQSAPFSFLNCGKFSRSTTGRPSVCTTLSCSSLYTSSVNQKYPGRRSKWDITQANGMKPRHSSIPDNNHVCHPNEKICPDHSNHILQYDSTATLRCSDNCCYSSKGSTQLTEITEITACLGQCDHNTKTESSVDLEMITMANQ